MEQVEGKMGVFAILHRQRLHLFRKFEFLCNKNKVILSSIFKPLMHTLEYCVGFVNVFCNFIKGPLILLCRFISLNRQTKFEFGTTFTIVVYALNWFW